jgi:hypothetical protein
MFELQRLKYKLTQQVARSLGIAECDVQKPISKLYTLIRAKDPTTYALLQAYLAKASPCFHLKENDPILDKLIEEREAARVELLDRIAYLSGCSDG